MSPLSQLSSLFVRSESSSPGFEVEKFGELLKHLPQTMNAITMTMRGFEVGALSHLPSGLKCLLISSKSIETCSNGHLTINHEHFKALPRVLAEPSLEYGPESLQIPLLLPLLPPRLPHISLHSFDPSRQAAGEQILRQYYQDPYWKDCMIPYRMYRPPCSWSIPKLVTQRSVVITLTFGQVRG